MSNPTTPTKSGDGINDIVRSLSARWALQLPIRDVLWSPSKVANPDAKEEQILRRIRFLYWKDNDALQLALARFDHHAQYVFSEWRYKPKGDVDVLPSRKPSESVLHRDSFLRRNDTPGGMAPALSDTLLRFLTQALDPAADDEMVAIHPSNDQLKEASIDMNRPHKQARISHFFTGLAGQGCRSKETHLNARHPSSDEFNPSQETSTAFEEIDMEDVAPVPASVAKSATNMTGNISAPNLPVGDEDIFETPPTTPLCGPHDASDITPDLTPSVHTDDTTTDLYLLQTPDMVALPKHPASHRKRSYPEPFMPSMSRKVSWEEQNHHSPYWYNVNHLEPRSNLTRSFGSLVSSSSPMTEPSTTRTTPNTSFYTESVATSFTSSFHDNDPGPPDPMKEGGRQPENKYLGMHDCVEIDRLAPAEREKGAMGPPHLSRGMIPPVNVAPVVVDYRVVNYIKRHLYQESPFDPLEPYTKISVPFRQTYEVIRVASSGKLPLVEFSALLEREINDCHELWSSLGTIIDKHGGVRPERTNLELWNKARGNYDGVAFNCNLAFTKKAGKSLFGVRMKPLKMEMSYRLSRKFGGDRFCIVGLPGLSDKELPDYLPGDAANARDEIIKWLVDTDHRFLGRVWRAFYLKPQATRARKVSPDIKYRVYMFATDGRDFVSRIDGVKGLGSAHISMTIRELLEWSMPAKPNADQSIMKFFARLALAVSNTIPTIEFRPQEIIRSDDAYADNPGERCLDIKRHEEKKNDLEPAKSQAAVMNDGCARISRAAVVAIAVKLGLRGQIPCAYQGRIGGAKGMWFIDTRGDTVPGSERDFWIEITDSQLKFRGHAIDDLYPDVGRLTFEVHAWSKPLVPASLNFQLMPILTDRGVPKEVFMRLLEEDLTARVADLQVAMDSALALKKWNQDNNSVAEERIKSGGVEMLGGLPSSRGEKINWFLEHGFVPRNCRFLKDQCYKAIAQYCQRLEDKMNIGLGRSTYAFMIADPLATLEENEVHVGFSSAFYDDRSGFHDTILNGIDLLVARMPASLPSDIQKVRAVFKPELCIYKDVVVFPSKGRYCLADKLSGGDYDGDRAWICWEPEVVSPFRNAEVHQRPGLAYYGITKDNTKVSDILHESDYVSRFLRKGFDFNLGENLLGMCTAYHEAFCYQKGKSIDDPLAKNIAVLLGHLVDRAKGGLVFTVQTWQELKHKLGLEKILPRPAYKDKDNAKPTNHIIDKLVFEVAKGVQTKALRDFSLHYEDAPSWDTDLVRVWKAEEEEAVEDKELKEVLRDIKAKLAEVHQFWTANPWGEDEDARKPTRIGGMSFRNIVEHCRDMFLKIEPLEGSECAIAKRWRRECRGVGPGTSVGHWSLLKASALFQQYPQGTFAWHIAGKELGVLKVRARASHQEVDAGGQGHLIVDELYLAYKLDAKYAKKMDRRAVVDEQEGMAGDAGGGLGVGLGGVGAGRFGWEGEGFEGEEGWGWEDMVDAMSEADLNE